MQTPTGKCALGQTKRRKATTEAKKLLRSPQFFNKFLLAMEKAGLVGEKLNALALFVVVISRLLRRPLNLFVKGNSSAGKNWLVSRVLCLLPKHALAEITSSSEKAWNYSGSTFRHCVVYLQERNEAAGPVHPMRLLISEGKITRLVPRWVNGELVTQKYVARGPVASISTTTKNQLEIDDETRHISIWADESAEQTRQIVKSYTKRDHGLSVEELRIWRMVHQILERRIGAEIVFPPWFEKIGDRLFVDDLRVRRYYPAFVEACRTVCLIRSFQSRKLSKDGHLEVSFEDFAITALIFDQVFVESLHRGQGSEEYTKRLVGAIAEKGTPVGASHLARKLRISMDKAYAKLRDAEKAGVIKQVNKPGKSNRKIYLPGQQPRFVSDPETLFRELTDLDKTIRFVHPITGKVVIFRR